MVEAVRFFVLQRPGMFFFAAGAAFLWFFFSKPAAKLKDAPRKAVISSENPRTSHVLDKFQQRCGDTPHVSWNEI